MNIEDLQRMSLKHRAIIVNEILDYDKKVSEYVKQTKVELTATKHQIVRQATRV